MTASWWMIERDDLEPRPQYFAWAYRPGELPKTWPHGSHYWTPDWQKGERFATKEEAEAHTNRDPLLHVRGHQMMVGHDLPGTPLSLCPFCGSAPFDTPQKIGGGHAIWCRECGTYGPHDPDDLDSPSYLWNARSLASRDPEAAKLEMLVEALTEAHQFAVLFLAFDGRDRHTNRMDRTFDDLSQMALKVDASARAALGAANTPEQQS